VLPITVLVAVFGNRAIPPQFATFSKGMICRNMLSLLDEAFSHTFLTGR